MKWRKVRGYPNYSVSDSGLVKNKKGKILTPWLTPNGYAQVHLYRDGLRSAHMVHALVLEAFRCRRPRGMEACHRNGVRSDNRLSNLYWGTHSENQRDQVRHGTHAGLRRKGSKHPLAKLCETDVERVRDMRLLGCSQQEVATYLGVARTTIQGIDSGRRWRHV